MSSATDEIAALLEQTGTAHHKAFEDVDGADADWPLWYAAYLHDRLPPDLKEEFTVSRLTKLFLDLDQRYSELQPDMPWHRYYAQFFLEKTLEQPATYSEFEVDQDEIPYLTVGQMIAVDRAMIDDYKISLTQMMENAGRSLAHLARERFLAGDPRNKKVTVLAGTGGNGGGALVAARRLFNFGALVTVVTTRAADSIGDVTGKQLSILESMNVPILVGDASPIGVEGSDLIIDGVIGYSLNGAPRSSAASLIHWANSQNAPILALDIPSGVDGTTGTAYDPAIGADATMTLALPKAGLKLAQNVGELYLADISVPPALYARAGLDLEVGPIFARSDILRLKKGNP